MPIRVLFVRLLGSEPDDDEAEEIVHGIDGGVHGIPEDGKRIYREPDQDLDGNDCEIRQQDAAKDPTNCSGTVDLTDTHAAN
jgi:hypothetical protein